MKRTDVERFLQRTFRTDVIDDQAQGYDAIHVQWRQVGQAGGCAERSTGLQKEIIENLRMEVADSQDRWNGRQTGESVACEAA